MWSNCPHIEGGSDILKLGHLAKVLPFYSRFSCGGYSTASKQWTRTSQGKRITRSTSIQAKTGTTTLSQKIKLCWLKEHYFRKLQGKLKFKHIGPQDKHQDKHQEQHFHLAQLQTSPTTFENQDKSNNTKTSKTKQDQTR